MPALPLSAFAPPGSIADFADHLVVHDLPGLPDDRRAETVAFAGRRIAHLPSPMKVGVTAVAALVAILGKVVGGARLTAAAGPPPGPALRRVRAPGAFADLRLRLGHLAAHGPHRPAARRRRR